MDNQKELEQKIIYVLLSDFRDRFIINLKQEDFKHYPFLFAKIYKVYQDGRTPNFVNISPPSEILDIIMPHYTHFDIEELITNLKAKKVSAEIRGLEGKELYDYMELAIKNRPSINKIYDNDEFCMSYLETYMSNKEKMESGKTLGTTVGWSKFDKYVGLFKGELVVISARPSIGKTALAQNIALNASTRGAKVLFISMEMNLKALGDRFMSIKNQVENTLYKYSKVNSIEDNYNNFVATFDTLSYAFNSKVNLSYVNYVVKNNNYDLVVIDYLNIMDYNKRVPKREALGTITSGLKQLAMETDTCILLLSQINRTGIGIPTLENIKDSGSIEEDADVVLLVHRDDRDSEEAQIIIAKNRTGQANLEIDYLYNLKTTTFIELT